mgnify:CR=1 FL=1
MKRSRTYCVLVLAILLTSCASTRQTYRQARLERSIDKIAELKCGGNVEGALRMSFAAEKKHGADPLLYVQRSALLEALGRVEEAADEGNRSIGLWPGGYLYMARFYRRHGDKASANSTIIVALGDSRVQDDARWRAEIHLLKATWYLEDGDKENALRECDIALILAPERNIALRERIETVKEQALKMTPLSAE